MTDEQMIAARRSTRRVLLTEGPRVLAARRAYVEAYASALRQGLSNDDATAIAREVLLERGGWEPKKRK